jgi:hypothetical protein
MGDNWGAVIDDENNIRAASSWFVDSAQPARSVADPSRRQPASIYSGCDLGRHWPTKRDFQITTSGVEHRVTELEGVGIVAAAEGHGTLPFFRAGVRSSLSHRAPWVPLPMMVNGMRPIRLRSESD